MNFETVIGLEIHAQLSTKSKLFSNASTEFGSKPNTAVNFIDAGLPGTLPVLNKKAVLYAIKFGMAINASINDLSYFERKNYFYPDLPKGYQISQFRRPIIEGGFIDISSHKVHIHHAHLEEDAGKSTHDQPKNFTSIDLNRAGNPLLEIVTTPCLNNAEQAVEFLKKLHELLRFLDICDGNMQEGSFRCDVNLSIREIGAKKLGVRTELKNLNSFRFIEKAIKYEEERHKDLILSGSPIIQQTRLYNPDTNSTHALRDKEEENDYRYFIDPDLLPIKISKNDLETIANDMPELPNNIRNRLSKDDNLSIEEIDFIMSTPSHLKFYEEVKSISKSSNKIIINWLKGTYTAVLNEMHLSFENPPVSSKVLSELLDKISTGIIQPNIAKAIFKKLLSSNKTIEEIMKNENYGSGIDTQELLNIINKTILNNHKQVAEYKSGKEKLFGFFVGIIMKETGGKADANEVTTLLKQAFSRFN
ncbi:MAG: glutaminyl-tRNA synthase (glutamine-hydrolyzing) subunit B [Legionellales bacterium RIFCSPHIGHO2_12_FULL_35_11]|nr:MAG: glutaminyl-tRNA synthase (glutamine-hydrolyzing) subunit B [Legionellales bacterium RIFCSPHIGHO2_12_FULL_35_11]